MLGAVSFAAVVLTFGLLIFDLISSRLFDTLFALAMGNTILSLLPRIGFARGTAIASAFALPALAIGIQWIYPPLQIAPYLAIVLINVFVSYVFGHGLVTGRTPLIMQIIRVTESGPEGTIAFQRYVHSQCWVWTVFGLMTALSGFVAMIAPATRPWLDPAILVQFAIQIVWFVLAHVYARRRYRRPETWIGTMRAMAHPAMWSRLEI